MPSTAEIRRLSPQALEELGRSHLREHLLAQAMSAHLRHRPDDPQRLAELLADRDCLRHPVRIVYGWGDMAAHQFAEPGLDPDDPTGCSRVLHVRPVLQTRPDLVLIAVAYMIPVLNYGSIVGDEECLCFGATLLGRMEEEFYADVCRVAAFVGAEPCYPLVAAS